MIFWGTLLALAWDRIAPLFRPCQLERLFDRYADWVHEHFNAGSRAHGLLAWSVAALAPALVVGLVGVWLTDIARLLGLAWSATVLYRCLGFGQVAALARGLTDALVADDLVRARERLHALGVARGPDQAPGELIGAAMDKVFRLGLERLFGVLFWFAILGPFGALAYALTHALAQRWRGDDVFFAVPGQIVPGLDWAPARLTAFSFAIVGNFEEAMIGWRSRAAEDGSLNEGLVRAAGLGALGVGQDAPGPEYVAGVASLFNRALLLWLGVLGLLWLGGL